MAENPLSVIKELDPELIKIIEDTRKHALAEGALPKKTKYLIALALDASHGAEDGVASLAQAAINFGATKEEITETLRVSYFISGVGSIYTAARALKGLL